MAGDSKSTAEKLAGDASSKAQAVGQNVLDTGSHYADKAQKSDAGKQAAGVADNIGTTAQTYADKAQKSDAGKQAASVADNVGTTAQHYADKAAANAPTAPGTQDTSKTYLEQAQDLAAGALNTASKAASGELSFLSKTRASANQYQTLPTPSPVRRSRMFEYTGDGRRLVILSSSIMKPFIAILDSQW